jgi:hypothetical protein
MERDEIGLPAIDFETALIGFGKAGLTNKEIAEIFCMSIHQFDRLMVKYPKLKEKLDEAKEEPNQMVEKALYKRALGYEVKETKKKNGLPVEVTIKEIAPDPVSCIFWLKNRDPGKWREVIEHKFTLSDRMDRANEAISNKGRKKALVSGD